MDRFSAGAAEVALRTAATAKTRVVKRAIAGIRRECSVPEERKEGGDGACGRAADEVGGGGAKRVGLVEDLEPFAWAFYTW